MGSSIGLSVPPCQVSSGDDFFFFFFLFFFFFFFLFFFFFSGVGILYTCMSRCFNPESLPGRN